MARRSMPNADAAWLHMDRPTNRMVINSVMWSEDRIDVETLRDILRERLVGPYPSFRRRAGERGTLGGGGLGGAPHFDVEPCPRTRRERLVGPYPTSRRRAVERGTLGGVDWEDDPDFDVDRHLHHLALPAPGDRIALQELIGDLASTPLDRDKALWDAYVVDGHGPRR